MSAHEAPRIHETALFAAGELVALQRDAAERARSGWPAVWKRVEAGGPVPGGELTSYLVRHAKAGSRERWTAPDRARPLTTPAGSRRRRWSSLLGPCTRRV